MGLEERLLNDMKAAMKSGDKVALETLRMLRSHINNARIAKGEDLSEEDVLGVLSKEAKKRKEAIGLYREGGRDDLADKEQQEHDLIVTYLPEALSDQELLDIIQKAIEESGAESLRDMGKVMGVVMPQVKGRADGKQVQAFVKKKLG